MELEEILKNNLCLGCGLCQSIFGEAKLRMDYDSDGFLRPIILSRLSPNENKLLNNVCPGINIRHKVNKPKNYFIGNFLEITTGFSTDPDVRYSGASGGALTGLAIYLVQENKVDCVIQIGASNTNPLKNESMVSQTEMDIINNSGSRYSPSATLIDLKRIISSDLYNSIAVIGKPCDIVGVRNYMKVNDKALAKVKYLLSFMCAGVPSINGTLNLVKEFGLQEEEVQNLKYRGDGWPGNFKITDYKGKEYKKSYNDTWGKELNKHLQFRCKICPDGTGEFADITCADAWEESDDGFPSFDERPGQSMIIVRTEVGKSLLNDAVKNGYITKSKSNMSIDEVKAIQPYQLKRKKNLLARLWALQFLCRKTHNYNRSMLVKASLNENPLRLMSNFFGTAKRSIK